MSSLRSSQRYFSQFTVSYDDFWHEGEVYRAERRDNMEPFTRNKGCFHREKQILAEELLAYCHIHVDIVETTMEGKICQKSFLFPEINIKMSMTWLGFMLLKGKKN
uniref:Uncharacterized protein n=1 Tax=Nicotiana tabacum TaxID=4097 RepID=A0A1S4BQI0_TOBAC|nr:PREDICTED: uncharacterized protein LOC107810832 [Nicotiana tabacum]